METWMIQPRSSALVRAYDPIRFWSSLTLVERHNVTGAAPGTWSVTGRNEGLGGLFTPGNGVIIHRGGVKVMSGPITSIKRGSAVSTVSGVSDTDVLDDRFLYPDPANPITAQTSDYDVRSGPAETLLLGYVNANIGPDALAGRRLSRLRIPSSGGRGKSMSKKGRLQLLGQTVADLAEAGGLHVEILQGEDTEPYLQFKVRTVTDRRQTIRFGSVRDFTGGIVGSDWEYTLQRPTATDAVAAGGGQGKARLFKQRVDSAAEAVWAAKVENVIDQRQTTDTGELNDAADDALSEGSNPVTVSFTITDSPDVKYRDNWFVGDTVGVRIDGLDLSNVVREVTTSVQVQEGAPTETVSAVVGSRDSSNWTTRENTKVAKTMKSLRALQAI